MNSAGTRSLQGYLRHLNPRKYFSRYLKQHREEWLELIAKYPNANRKFLLQQKYFVYSWLKKNDAEWFEEHLPLPLKSPRNLDILDWQKVDNELSEKVKKACRKIKTQKKPLRVCITEIIRRTGDKNRLEGKLSKLPKTKRIVKKNLESLEDFMVRKTIWASNSFIEEKVAATKNQLATRASIRNSTSKNSTLVQKTIEECLLRITKAVDS
jgi:DNA repair exonuclease SbcCD nuclease subunit